MAATTSDARENAAVDGPDPARTDGERWARAELGRLRARRFAPRAAAEFLHASWRRSAATRRARPALARQARRWMAAGAAGQLVWAGGDGRRSRDGLAWWALVTAMVDWHLGMLETEDGRRRDLGAADALTLGRAWLVPVARHSASTGVVAAALLTDALDGILARRAGATRAGRDLEGLVDACFQVAALRGARERGALGPWAVRAEVARLAAGSAYATTIWFGRAAPPSRAVLRAGRAATLLRGGGLLAGVAGRRRLGGALLASGSAASAMLTLRALTAPQGTGPAPATPASPTGRHPAPLIRAG
jgi:phosphatidylglycerophosphate synthase